MKENCASSEQTHGSTSSNLLKKAIIQYYLLASFNILQTTMLSWKKVVVFSYDRYDSPHIKLKRVGFKYTFRDQIQFVQIKCKYNSAKSNFQFKYTAIFYWNTINLHRLLWNLIQIHGRCFHYGYNFQCVECCRLIGRQIY